MNNSRTLIAIAVLLLGSALAETPSYQILNYPFSSRSAAMGGTRAVNLNGVYEVQGNPANTVFLTSFQAQAGIVNHLVGIKGYSAGLAIPLQRHGLSLESVYFDYGQFEKTDVLGVTTGEFGFRELSLALGYAFQFSDKISLGLRGGNYQLTADSQTRSDLYYDAGAVYSSAKDSLSVGLYLSSSPVGQSNEVLPRQLRLGSSKILSHLPLMLNLDGIYNFDNKLAVAAGVEILLHDNFRVRLGLNSNRFGFQTDVSEADFVAGASAGFILNWHGLILESASQSFGGIGWITQMSMSYEL